MSTRTRTAEKSIATGRVVSALRAGVGGLRVEIVDKGVGPDIVLAVAETDADGSYRIEYPTAPISKRRKTTPDIQARTFANAIFLGASEVRYNAQRTEVLNVLLPDSAAAALPSEYETLSSALAVHYDGKLRDLKESGGREDVTYLANKTGWDARAVALAALADQFAEHHTAAATSGSAASAKSDIGASATSRTAAETRASAKSHVATKSQRTSKTLRTATAAAPSTTAQTKIETQAPRPVAGIDPSLYYALFRAGLPVTQDTLYATSMQTVEGVWRQAIAQGVIPKRLVSEIPEALRTFQSISADRLLDAKFVSGSGTLRQMLQITLGDDTAKLQRFAELYAAHRDDASQFWTEVERAFGDDTAQRLQFDGQLGQLTLNNASLMERLHLSERQQPLTSTLDLVKRGYYASGKWAQLLDDTVPDTIPGNDPTERKANYARMLAAQVRLSYPTAVVAEQVSTGEVALTTDSKLRVLVSEFLTQHQGKFELGLQPVEQYIADNGLGDSIDTDVVSQLKRLHRVYQMTPSDAAMNALLRKNIDSAYQIVHYDPDAFVRDFGRAIDSDTANDRSADDLDGAAQARLIYAKAQSVYNTVLQAAVDYGSRRVTPRFGFGKDIYLGPFPNNGSAAGTGTGSGTGLGTGSGTPSAPSAPSSAAAAVLEKLFGSMDYCTCEECRSILGPAAYLVDLLNFTNPQPTPAGSANPRDVLFARRPDIQHLPLTCANTNTILPYIDVVNETLEWFVAHGSLAGYQGYTTSDDVSSDELLACPQNLDDNAYAVLQSDAALFPPPLPFSRQLELSRRLFQKFGVSLTDAMTTLRVGDDIERSATVPYGWRDILMERLGISRMEYRLLTDGTLTLQQIYGYAASTSDADTIADLSNAEVFVRIFSLQVDQLVEVLRTRFINPACPLIPALESLGVTFKAIQEVSDGTLDAPSFMALLPTGPSAPDPSQFGGDIVQWIKTNITDVMGLIVMSNPTNPSDLCTLSDLHLRYANPDTTANTLDSVDFVRLLRFIRLWRKLGLTIQQTDVILSALSPVIARVTIGGTFAPSVGLSGTVDSIAWTFTTPTTGTLDDIASGIAAAISTAVPGYEASPSAATIVISRRETSNTGPMALTVVAAGSVSLTVVSDSLRDEALLDVAFLTLLPRLGFVLRVTGALELSPGNDLSRVLALWSSFGTFGKLSLYASMFLNPASPLKDGAFARDASGNVLQDAAIRLLDHELALRGAFNLTGAEFALIASGQLGSPSVSTALNFDTNTSLTLANITAIYRRGFLARSLQVSVLELLLLAQYTALDPFAVPDPQPSAPSEPDVIRLIRLVRAMSDADLAPIQALYVFWNHDISGTSTPDISVITTLARTLRVDFAAIDTQFVLKDDPTGSLAQQLMASVYGAASAGFFFGLLNGTISVSIAYAGFDPASTVTAAAGRLTYDTFAQQLTYGGYLDATTNTPLITAAGSNSALVTALQGLASASAAGPAGTFFQRFPELLGAYDAFVTSAKPSLQDRRSDLLNGLLPSLIIKRKQQQSMADATSSAGIDAGYTAKLLEDPTVLSSANDATGAAVNDFIALGARGLSVQFYLDNVVSGTPGQSADTAGLVYDGKSAATTLPAPTGGTVIAGRWIGYLDCPQDDLYRISVATDGAGVDLQVDGKAIVIQKQGAIWMSAPIPLTAGSLTFITLTVTGLTANLSVSWQARSPGSGIQPIDPQYLYSATLTDNLRRTYTRFLKAVSLASALSLTADEIAFLGTQDSSRVATSDTQDASTPGINSFTPASMANIHVGSVLDIDSGAAQETVTVTGISATAFTATTTKAHDGTTTPFSIVIHAVPSLGKGWINTLVVDARPDADTARQLGLVLVGLLDFSRLKSALSPRDERFLDVLRNPEATLPTGQNGALALTGWSEESLDALLQHFFSAADKTSLSSLENFRRVYTAFHLIKTCAVAAPTLLDATTNDPSSAQVSDLQSAVRALYAHVDWLNAIKPINDAMRIAQRDALTARVLQLTASQSPQPNVDLDTPVNTPDTLFEYLLMDVSMDCCMQTSRIRLALSSVQLFIERCIRSLELNLGDPSKNVSPACFSADQWRWRKRFRVWQANRMCFLTPASYLYEDIRDDQSPIFKSVMGKLLQSDITDDAATEAYLDYLFELEQVAKLEPCAMYCEPVSPQGPTNPVVHVVARTAGAKRAYYYSKFDGVSWTAWEQIKLAIDGSGVTLAISDDRLLLFWVQVVRQPIPLPPTPPPPASSDNSGGDSITTKNIGDIVSSVMTSQSSSGSSPKALTNIGVNLFWSEYHNGKWQVAKSSDTQDPCMMGPIGADEQRTFSLAVYPDSDATQRRLWIQVYGGPGKAQFLFYNTHSVPIAQPPSFPTAVVAPNPYWRGSLIRKPSSPPGAASLCVDYQFDDSHSSWYEDDVITTALPIVPTLALTVDPQSFSHAASSSSWTAPFLYADTSNVFYVSPVPRLLGIGDFKEFGQIALTPAKYSEIPTVINRYSNQVLHPPPRDPAFDPRATKALATAAAARFVSEDAYIARGLSSGGTVAFGDRQIGPSGAVDD